MKTLKVGTTSIWFWLSVSTGLHILAFSSLTRHKVLDLKFAVEEAPYSIEATLLPWRPPPASKPPSQEAVERPLIEETKPVVQTDKGTPDLIVEKSEPTEWGKEPVEEVNQDLLTMHKTLEESEEKTMEPEPEQESKAEGQERSESMEASAPTMPSLRGAESQQSPVPLVNPAPIYPSKARKLGHEGTVTIEVRVSEEGKPSAVEVVASSGYPELDRRACDTILKKWRFRPASENEMPEAASIVLAVHFSLR